jgi:hypothetical protein
LHGRYNLWDSPSLTLFSALVALFTFLGAPAPVLVSAFDGTPAGSLGAPVSALAVLAATPAALFAHFSGCTVFLRRCRAAVAAAPLSALAALSGALASTPVSARAAAPASTALLLLFLHLLFSLFLLPFPIFLLLRLLVLQLLFLLLGLLLLLFVLLLLFLLGLLGPQLLLLHCKPKSGTGWVLSV